eukprot:GFKZ01002024.1.p1 GENE.GFKZ01002024.1~~GFKZ01002024.1.p1  ORF type:complete len:572 (-),score=69.02 GFKZ01002024.1:308-2023(-)
MPTNLAVTHLLQSLNTAVQDLLSERALLAEETKSLRLEVQRLRSKLATRDAQYTATRHAIVSTMQMLSFLDKDLIVEKNLLPSLADYPALNSLPASSQGVSVNPFLPSPFKSPLSAAAGASNETTATCESANDPVLRLPAQEGDKNEGKDATTASSDLLAPPQTRVVEKCITDIPGTMSSNAVLSQPSRSPTDQTSERLEAGKQSVASPSTAISSMTTAREMGTLRKETETGTEAATETQEGSPHSSQTPTQAKPSVKSYQVSQESSQNESPPSSSTAASPTTSTARVKVPTRSDMASPSNSSYPLNRYDADTITRDKLGLANSPSVPEDSLQTKEVKASPAPWHRRQRRHVPRPHRSRVSGKMTRASSSRIKGILGELNNENSFAVGKVSDNRSPTSSTTSAWALGTQTKSDNRVGEPPLGLDSECRDQVKASAVTPGTGEGSPEIKEAAGSDEKGEDVDKGENVDSDSKEADNETPSDSVGDHQDVKLGLIPSDNSGSSPITAHVKCCAEEAANSACTAKGEVNCRGGGNGNLGAFQGPFGHADDTKASRKVRGAKGDAKQGRKPSRRN